MLLRSHYKLQYIVYYIHYTAFNRVLLNSRYACSRTNRTRSRRLRVTPHGLTPRRACGTIGRSRRRIGPNALDLTKRN